MHLISSLLFAISANIDSFIVGMSYGIKKSNIDLLKSTVISLVTLIGTVAAIIMGGEISQFLPPSITGVIGCLILIGLGLYYMAKSFWGYVKEHFRKSKIHTRELDFCTNHSNSIKNSLLTFKEGLFLGLALSINNFGMGIGASMTGLNLVPTALISLVVSVVFLYGGNFIGKTKMPHITDETADIISGLILIGLAIYEMLL